MTFFSSPKFLTKVLVFPIRLIYISVLNNEETKSQNQKRKERTGYRRHKLPKKKTKPNQTEKQQNGKNQTAKPNTHSVLAIDKQKMFTKKNFFF